MATRTDDVMHLCCEMSAQIKLTWTSSINAGLITGGAVVVGGLLFGPVGILLGAIGGGVAGWLTSPNFKSVPQILMESTPEQKRRLYEDVMAALGNLTWRDAAHLLAIVMNNPTLKNKVTAVVMNHIKNINK
uniref:protein C19orf12 homolog n=1 Tax=Scatophagus argus TaxID=75038 RepID=UPI001ED838AD|nr:protein C19orf12 homolog [Scatophagus argus]